MMRYCCNTMYRSRLQDVFNEGQVDEYNEGLALLNRLVKDPTTLRPGNKSIVFLTPFNSDWCWNNRTYNIEANEVWAETNMMSELTVPVSMDKMIDCMLDEMSNETIRFNSANAQLIYELQRSLRNGFELLRMKRRLFTSF